MNKDRMEIMYSNSMRREQQKKEDTLFQGEISEIALQENEDLLQLYLERSEAMPVQPSYVERFKWEVKQLIARNKIADAIYRLGDYQKEQKNEELSHAILLVSASLMRLQWEEMSGTVTSESFHIEKNKIAVTVLQILKLL